MDVECGSINNVIITWLMKYSMNFQERIHRYHTNALNADNNEDEIT